MTETTRTVKIFYSYSHLDERLRDRLARHLDSAHNRILVWHDRKIEPGVDWEEEIDTNLNAADIILLLLSVDFMASKYCTGKEMKRALERHEAGEARVIPVVLRPIRLQNTPFSKLQMLPTNGRAVVNWSKQENAFVDIADGVYLVIDGILLKHYVGQAETHLLEQKYDAAIAAYDRAIEIDNDDPFLHNSKGDILFGRDRFEAALSCYDAAIRLDSQNTHFLANKAKTLLRMNRHAQAISVYKLAIENTSHDTDLQKEMLALFIEMKLFNEALISCDSLIRLEPSNAQWHLKRADILLKLGRYAEAFFACEEAIRLDPQKADFYLYRGDLHSGKHQYEEALVDYGQAIEYGLQSAQLYRNRATVLARLKRYEEAFAAYDQAIALDAANPRTAYIWNAKGDTFSELLRFEEALTCYEKATQLKLDYDVAYENKGYVLEKLAEQIARDLGQRAQNAREQARKIRDARNSL